MERPLVLITGGARRVGRAIAVQLATSGFDPAITYWQSEAEAASLRAVVAKLGATCLTVQADLTQIPSAIDHIRSELSPMADRLLGLVNNASIYLPDSAIDSAGPMYRLHCEAPLLLSRLFAPQLKANRGCVINMCDILGARPMPGWLGYCSSKAALANITMGLARELAPEARVCGIAPGVAQWPDDFEEAAKALYLNRVPMQRAGTPEEVAKLAQFLLTEGTYITGQIITIDGGRSIA